MDNGYVQIRSALRSMAEDARRRHCFQSGWDAPSLLRQLIVARFGNIHTPPDSLLNAKRLNWFAERLRKAGFKTTKEDQITCCHCDRCRWGGQRQKSRSRPTRNISLKMSRRMMRTVMQFLWLRCVIATCFDQEAGMKTIGLEFMPEREGVRWCVAFKFPCSICRSSFSLLL